MIKSRLVRDFFVVKTYTQAVPQVPPVAPVPVVTARPRHAHPWLRITLPVLYVFIHLIPLYIFFDIRGGLAAIPSSDTASLSYFLFPLFGLEAFTFLWLQLLIGSSMRPLLSIFPRMVHFHRRHGITALTFACIHPLLLIVAVGVTDFFTFTFTAPELIGWVLVGYVQLLLLITLVTSALLRHKKWLRSPRWRYIHYISYVAFVLVWLHSWFLGSDVQATPLKSVWIAAAVSSLLAVGWRIHRSKSLLHT